MLRGIPSTMGDDYQLNVLSLLRHAAVNFPNTEVVYRRSDGDWGRSTYAEEMRRVSRIAHALTKLGIGPESTVGVLDWNSRRHFELYFAVPALGATMVQLNLRLGEADLAVRRQPLADPVRRRRRIAAADRGEARGRFVREAVDRRLGHSVFAGRDVA